MKKLLTILTVVALAPFSANALDQGDFSVTAGISTNSAVYGASGTERNRNDSNTIISTKKESGVFTESHESGFIEINAGPILSLGFEHTPDSISTPQNESREDREDASGNSLRSTVSVDFNDLNIAYLKLNVPNTGLYLKAGYVETDLDIKESMASGRTYNNVSTEGTLFAVGYSHAINDSPFGIRFEGSYMELDDVTTSNGVAADGATAANGGRNQIDTSNMQGLNAKLALTITLGNN